MCMQICTRPVAYGSTSRHRWDPGASTLWLFLHNERSCQGLPGLLLWTGMDIVSDREGQKVVGILQAAGVVMGVRGRYPDVV
jgi:hypothetical protein